MGGGGGQTGRRGLLESGDEIADHHSTYRGGICYGD